MADGSTENLYLYVWLTAIFTSDKMVFFGKLSVLLYKLLVVTVVKPQKIPGSNHCKFSWFSSKIYVLVWRLLNRYLNPSKFLIIIWNEYRSFWDLNFLLTSIILICERPMNWTLNSPSHIKYGSHGFILELSV